MLLYSGHEEENARHTQGVALMLFKVTRTALVGWESHGSRIIKASFKTKKDGVAMNIVQCYAPINDSNDDIKAFNNRSQALQDLLKEEETTMENNWKGIKEALTSTCQKVLGLTKHHHKEWISIKTLDRIKERKNKKTAINNSRTRAEKVQAHAEYIEANKQVKKSIMANKKKCAEEPATMAEKAAREGNMEQLYDTTKKLAGRYSKPERSVKDKESRPITKIQQRCFEELLNRPAPMNPPDIKAAHTDIPIDVTLPAIEEFGMAIRQMKKGKAAGPGNIPAEALKLARFQMVNEISFVTMEQSKDNSKYHSNSEKNLQYDIENMILSIGNNKRFSELSKEFGHEIIVAMANLLMNKWVSLNPQTPSAPKNDTGTLNDSEKCSPIFSAFTLSETKFSLTWDSKSLIIQLLKNNPVTPKEKLELYPPVDGISRVDIVQYLLDNIVSEIRKERYRGTTGRLMGTVPQIPPPSSIQKNLHWTKEKYTSEENVIEHCREQIINCINSNPITIISGPPGIGKTTYLPQILVDECHMQSHRCRIICSQPYRLYAHINADRLAQIRGEITGQTVGYQIRLESKVSPKTLLTFCTHGVLLRTICADSRIMAGTTHIIVDEIEDNEIPENLHLTKLQNTEAKLMSADSNGETYNPDVGYGILLAIIPSLLTKYQHLKVILIVNSRIYTHDFCHKNILSEIRNPMNLINSPTSVPITYCEIQNTTAQHKYEISSINFKGQAQQKFNLINNGFDKLSSVSSHSMENNPSPDFTAKDRPPIAKIQNNISSENVVCKPLQGFSKYYNGAPIISIPYRAKQVTVYHLEDILEWTGYSTSRMNEALECLDQDNVRCRNMYFWLTTKEFDKYISCEYHINTTDDANTVSMVEDKTFNRFVSNAVSKVLCLSQIYCVFILGVTA
ncbi:unnamed protein product [Schistosoma margrebowiei]|uniref:Uncharacterized protein n=1 Tax=Schistosoma margrebowiei TaxID=48269 RepID=A0A183LIS4_9TREM|nr:unnamed protein product [Schistosoma margrebowiei]